MADEAYDEKGIELFGIEWVPLFIPLRRRIESFAAFFWYFCVLAGMFINFFCMFYIFVSPFWPLAVLYIIWIYYDRHTAHNGGRPNFKLWQAFRDYFPISLIKTVDLPSDQNYLFCVYPHGILASGAVLNFATDINRFGKLYPGLQAHLLTLSFNFNVPFTRETILGLGGCSAAEKSILNLFRNKEGKVGVLVVGGAAESAKSKPGTYRIVIKNRKGFVRVALKAGVNLVPVISFGENDVYDQFKSPSISSFQYRVRKLFGFVPIIPRGRGFFQYTFGLVPRRRPINTVGKFKSSPLKQRLLMNIVLVGKPIPVVQNTNPTKKEVDFYHSKFMTEIETLFNENKGKYDARGEAAELIME